MLYKRQQYYHSRQYWLQFFFLIRTVLSFHLPLSFPSSSSIFNIPSPQPPANNHVIRGNHRTGIESRRHPIPSPSSLHTSTNDNTDSLDSSSSTITSPTKVYFDLSINNAPLGRLTFLLPPTPHLPLHAANFLSLASSQRRSIDPKATYRGCTFQHSPNTIDDGSARYRWGHACEGYGTSGLSAAERARLASSDRLRECKHAVFGGAYYGLSYGEVVGRIRKEGGEREAVLLTVPSGAGSSKFSIVRVSESPKEWGERLLINSVVLGYLDCGDGTSLDVLRRMARQRVGPPKIVDCGVI